MTRRNEDLEARLLEKAQLAIREMLDQKGNRHNLTMSEMEKMVGEFETHLCEIVMQELAEDSEPTSQLCPDCGGKLRSKGKRKRKVVTVRGEIEVERDYTICTICGGGYFPPR